MAISLVLTLEQVNSITHQHYGYFLDEAQQGIPPISAFRATGAGAHMLAPTRDQYDFLVRRNGAVLTHKIAFTASMIHSTVEAVRNQTAFMEEHIDPKVQAFVDSTRIGRSFRRLPPGMPRHHRQLLNVVGPYGKDVAQSNYNDVRNHLLQVNELLRELRLELIPYLDRTFPGVDFARQWGERGVVESLFPHDGISIAGAYRRQSGSNDMEWRFVAAVPTAAHGIGSHRKTPNLQPDAGHIEFAQLRHKLQEYVLTNGLPRTPESSATLAALMTS